jgi:hypothetical protein
MEVVYTSGLGDSVRACLANDTPEAEFIEDRSIAPEATRMFWYVVRNAGPMGPGTYDDDGPGLAASRDDEIDDSVLGCP